MSHDQGDGGGSGRGTPASDEVYCMSCGSVIKEVAEICPECGVRQIEEENETGSTDTGTTETQTNRGSHSLSASRQRELESIANKDVTTVMLVSFLITPVGYLMIGKVGLAVINFFTLNYLLLGVIIVPFHTRKIIKDARAQLRDAGVQGY